MTPDAGRFGGGGDRFEREIGRHREAIFGHALRLTRSHDDAHDLAQDAIIRAGRAYARFDGENFKAWVLRIVTNLHINGIRAKARRPAIRLGDWEEEARAEGGFSVGGLLDGELHDEVLAALDLLPPPFARAVLLVDVAGVGREAAAVVEGVPPGTIRSRLHRGRLLLKESLLGYAREAGYLRGPRKD